LHLLDVGYASFLNVAHAIVCINSIIERTTINCNYDVLNEPVQPVHSVPSRPKVVHSVHRQSYSFHMVSMKSGVAVTTYSRKDIL